MGPSAGAAGTAASPPRAGTSSPPDLPRETVVIELPPERREGLRLVGHAESERPVHRREYVVQLVRRARHVRADSPRSGVVTAPARRVAACVAPDSNRCRYDLSVIVHVIAARLQLHLPLHRQSAVLARMGVRHGRSAMCGHLARVSEALRPLHDHMVSLILA